jgi:hypothetical protein
MFVEAVESLLAIESIKKLKAQYWYAMDTKDWALLASVFTEDAIVDFRGERDLAPGQGMDRLRPVEEALAAGDETTHKGRDNIVRWYTAVLEHWVTVHHGHTPIIDIVGPDVATAIWPLFDYIDNGRAAMKGYGHYHERYRKENGHWRISHLALTRLRKDGTHPATFVD